MTSLGENVDAHDHVVEFSVCLVCMAFLVTFCTRIVLMVTLVTFLNYFSG